MAALTDLTIAGAREGLRKKEFSARELAEAHIAAVEAARPLNAYLVETPERALEMASASDARLARGDARALEGIPLAIKDLFCTEGIPTTAGSHILEGFKPPYESTVTANLWKAGATMLGKVNMDEFAMGSSNITSAFGPVENPWRRHGDNRPLVPGGSSGGSAAAVAARAAMGATGTDTGGSIRQPGAFCGVPAMMGSYGRVSRYGLIAFASSLDRIGPFARNVKDIASVLQIISGRDPQDSTSTTAPVPDYRAETEKPVKGLRIGVPKEYFGAGMDEGVRKKVEAGIELFKKLGCKLLDIHMPHTDYAIATYYIIATAEASSNLARYDGVRYGLRVEGDSLLSMYRKTRGAGFGAEVKRRIMLGTYVLSAGYYDAYYLKGQKVRALIAQDFRDAFTKVDAIVTPTSPVPAFRLGERTADPMQMYLADIYTVTGSLAGVPGISVPCGKVCGKLPVGLQLFGPAFGEARVLQLAHAFEGAGGADL